jgi:hypothetical protein
MIAAHRSDEPRHHLVLTAPGWNRSRGPHDPAAVRVEDVGDALGPATLQSRARCWAVDHSAFD